MGVDFNAFLGWSQSQFGEENVVVKGHEVHINSPWVPDDAKFKLACDPSGGKRGIENGVYRCFKTERKGTLVRLVMDFEYCDYPEAIDILEGGGTLRELEKRLEEFFAAKNGAAPEPSAPPPGIELPEHCELITRLPDRDPAKAEAAGYLTGRKIPPDGFYYCGDGLYRQRVIIPYYDSRGNLIYFNGRALNPKSSLRYLGPPKELGIGKGDVLYAHQWPKAGTRVYVCEGEFDARTLNLCGFYGFACGGRYLTEKQLMMLRPYKVCMAFDSDRAGYDAQIGKSFQIDERMTRKDIVGTDKVDLGNALLKAGFKNVTYVRPPKVFKDWNKMMCEVGPDMVAAYIRTCEKKLDEWAIIEQLASGYHA